MRKAWMDRPHGMREDADDYSMCICGVPGDEHWRVEGLCEADPEHRTPCERDPLGVCIWCGTDRPVGSES